MSDLLQPKPAGTDKLIAMMRERYPAPDWALFLEVPRSTGFSSVAGYCDAVAMSMYPSRGLELHGFELKASRSDWRKELAQPGKAETLFGYCDRWWLVAGDKSIPKDGELPITWGMLAPRADGKLAVVKQAPQLSPKPIDRGLLASLVRRAHREAQGAIEDRVQAQLSAVHQRHEQERRQAIEHGKEEYRRLLKQVTAFELASGVSIRRGWQGGEQIGAAVKLVLDGGIGEQADAIRHAVERIKRAGATLQEILDALPKEKG